MTGQGPQENFNAGLLLGTEDGDWLGPLLMQALKSPSWPYLERWVPPAQFCGMQKLGEDTTALQHPNLSDSTFLSFLTQQTPSSTHARTQTNAA